MCVCVCVCMCVCGGRGGSYVIKINNLNYTFRIVLNRILVNVICNDS